MPVKFPDKPKAVLWNLAHALSPVPWEAIDGWDPAEVSDRDKAWILFKRWMTHPPRTASEGLLFYGSMYGLYLDLVRGQDRLRGEPPFALGYATHVGEQTRGGWYPVTIIGFNGVLYHGRWFGRGNKVALRAAAGQFHKTLKGWRL